MRFCVVLALAVSSCAGESVHRVPVCQAAWQELRVPHELLPFYPQAAVWQSGRLFAVRAPSYLKFPSQELGLIYDPVSGFSALPDEGMPAIDGTLAVVTTDDEIVFISSVNDTGALDAIWTYDPALESWRALPLPDSASGGVTAAARLGNEIAIDYERINSDAPAPAPVQEVFLRYRFGDEAWTEVSQPPIADWYAPALAWTGTEMLAWGGAQRASEIGDPTPISAGARYDPARDTWASMSDQGAPTGSRWGATLVWTDPGAVAWGSGTSDAGRYDPTLDRWHAVSTPSGAGFGETALAVKGLVVSWTGSGTWSDRLETYDPGTDTWSDAPTRCGPSPRNRPVLVGTDDGVMVWGGSAECAGATDPSSCVDQEFQRAFYLPNPALFGEVEDSGECTCPPPR